MLYPKMISEYLDTHFINKLNDDIIKSKLPAYRQVSSIVRNKFIHEGPSSALAVGMKVNNCRDNPTQGIDHSRLCRFCPGEMASEFHVAWKCPQLSKLRNDLGINTFKNICSLNEYQEDSATYYAYITGMDAQGKHVTCLQFDKRMTVLSEIRTKWLFDGEEGWWGRGGNRRGLEAFINMTEEDWNDEWGRVADALILALLGMGGD